MAEPDVDKAVEFYTTRPPEWLSGLHNSADVGFPGFHPPRPGQEEDSLVEKFLKDGFSSSSGVAAETYSALSSIKDELSDKKFLSYMEKILDKVYARRHQEQAELPPSSFKLPSRATVNEHRRTAWVSDLANSSVPLQKLGRSVPGGLKGHDLLEMLQSNHVTIPRALWYIRVLGGNETYGMRARPNFNPLQYSVEWAHIMTSYLKKLLADITLPSPARPGLNIKQTFKSHFLEPASTEKWAKRCTYFLDLLQSCYCEGLLDHYTFLSWLASQFSQSASSIPQLSLVCRLAEEYIDGLVRYRQLTRVVLQDSLGRIKEVTSDHLGNDSRGIINTLRYLIVHVFSRCPDSLVCPPIWKLHGPLLCSILREIENDTVPSVAIHEGWNELSNMTAAALTEEVTKRNEMLVLRLFPPSSNGGIASRMEEINRLNGTVCGEMTPIEGFYFAESQWSEKLDFILMWSVTDLQYGDYRRYAAAKLLRGWNPATAELASSLQDYLFDWLESRIAQFPSEQLDSVARLFGELIRRDIFSYHQYIQRLIARNEKLGVNDEGRSSHSELLRRLPLTTIDAAVVRQRRIILYGHKSRVTEEDSSQEAMHLELKSAIHFLSEDSQEPASADVETLPSRLNAFLRGNPYEQEHILLNWLVPAVRGVVERTPFPSTAELDCYCLVLELFALSKSFLPLLRLICILFRRIVYQPLLEIVVEMTTRFANIWSLMDVHQVIAESLLPGLSLWGSRRLDLRSVFRLVNALGLNLYIPAATMAEVSEYIHSPQLDSRGSSQQLPQLLPEILLLAQDKLPGAPERLATSLWTKHRSAPEFGWVIWDNTFASIRQIPALFVDTESQFACVMQFVEFLVVADRFLAEGLDPQVGKWLEGAGQNELRALPSSIWPLLATLLNELLSKRVLTSITIVVGVLSLVWRLAARERPDANRAAMLRAAERISLHVLAGKSEELGPRLPTRGYHRLASERANLFNSQAVWMLVEALADIIHIEVDQDLDAPCRERLAEIRCEWTVNEEFRVAVFSNIDRFRTTLMDLLSRESGNPQLKDRIAEAGKLIMTGSPRNAAIAVGGQAGGLWSLQRTAIRVQLTLLQYSVKETSSLLGAEIDDFVTSFFEGMSPEEADFIAELSRGSTVKLRSKFLTAGLQRIMKVFCSYSTAQQLIDSQSGLISTAGCLLRMLACLTEPWSADSLDCAPQDIEIQNEFATVLFTRITDVLSLLYDSPPLPFHAIAGQTTILLKLLHFVLSFASNLTPQSKALLTPLHSSLLKAILAIVASEVSEPVDINLLLDTAAWVFDELDRDDSLVGVAALDISREEFDEGSSLCPLPLLRRIVAMTNGSQYQGLGHNLAFGLPRDTFAISIQARPWEWLDHSEIQDDPSEGGSFRNATSIPFGNFSTLANEEFFSKEECVMDSKWSAMALSSVPAVDSLSIFERDWRESRTTTRLLSPMQSEAVTPADRPDGHFSAPIMKGSPAPSLLSRSSGQTSVGSWKQSPTVRSDPSEETHSAGGLGKRKISEEAADTIAASKKSRVVKNNRNARSKKK